jgi:hypothetical protein
MSAAAMPYERKIARILKLVESLEEIPVPDLAKKLKKTPEWVRKTFPIIHHGPRSQRVRLVDVEEYRSRRTVFPENGRMLHDNGR